MILLEYYNVIIPQQQGLGRTYILLKFECTQDLEAMNTLLIGLSFSLICYINGLEDENILNRQSMYLEALPLEQLLEMKKELRKKGKLN